MLAQSRTAGGLLSSESDDEVGGSRCSRRRSAGGDGGTTLFRSLRSDEDGGNPANIAASGASNRTERDVREKRPEKLEGAGHPATPSGPPLTNTLQAPGRNPLTANGIGWNPPQQLA